MSSSSRQPTPRRRNSISSVPVTSGQPDMRPSIPALNLPAGFPVDSTETDPNSAKDEDLDLNNVQVIDDLSINRWLLRIVRLGASYVSTGSNGYKTAAGKSVPATSSGVGGYLNSLRAGGRRHLAGGHAGARYFDGENQCRAGRACADEPRQRAHERQALHPRRPQQRTQRALHGRPRRQPL